MDSVLQISLDVEFVKTALFAALLENSAVTGMLDLSMRLIHRDWPVITFPSDN
jgi:hypothetical protein